MYADESSLAIVLVLWGVWGVIGLGLYIWYLFALASLFPRIGLPSGEGWIPVWNESRILQRGGFSPWLVLLMFVPGVSVAFVVFRLIAIHRLHTELGKGTGLTVLALFIPPLWATMLAVQLRDAGRGPVAASSAPAQRYAPANQTFAAPAYPGAPAAQQGGYAPQQPAPQQPQQRPEPSPWAAPPAVQLPTQGAASSAAPAYGAPEAQAQAPAQSQALPDTPAFETLGFDSLMAQASRDAGAPPAPPVVAPGAPAFSSAAPSAQWGFGHETEEAYQQLSTQEVQPLSLPFSAEPQAVEPFTWPGTVADMPPAPRAAEPFAVPESAWAAPVAPRAPVPEQMQAQDPAEESELESPSRPAPATTAPPSAEPTTTAPTLVPVTVAAPAAESGLDEELDHTVLVNRAPRERWVLELPDASLLPLPSNDVIVGRRPSSSGESSVLVIPDSTRTLSKSHVRLHVIDGAWVVTDLDSTNGLAVIDEAGEELVVAPGVSEPATEEMMFGTLRVRLRLVALDG